MLNNNYNYFQKYKQTQKLKTVLNLKGNTMKIRNAKRGSNTSKPGSP